MIVKRGLCARIAALVLAGALGGPAGAATIDDYTSFHVLGDSLSDVGNVYRTTRGLEPKSPPYYKGRFSNGPVWADRVATAFRKEGLPTSNNAWGGAKARTDRDGIPDLSLQALRYEALADSRKGDRPLVALFAGGNDILRAAPNASGVDAVGRKAANAVGNTAKALRADGVRDFLFFTLPDVGKIPKYADDRKAGNRAANGVRAFNKTLRSQVSALRRTGANVSVVDVNALFDDLLENPRKYGILNTKTPCLGSGGSVCTKEQGIRRAFFDSIHPNRVVHRRIGEEVLEVIDDSPDLPFGLASPVGTARLAASGGGTAVAPVPLPPSLLLLGAGVAALGGLRLRRRAAA